MPSMIILCLLEIHVAYASQPLLDWYNNSEMVLVGKVISLSQVPATTNSSSQYPNQTRYDIQVEQYYKNPQSAKLITVYGYAKGIYFSNDPTYNVGDRLFLYVNKENGYYQIQSNSFKLDNDCNARTMIPLATLPFESPAISSPALGHDFYLSDPEGNTQEFFHIGNNITINFNELNALPVVKSATVELIVKTNNDTRTVMDDKKDVIVPACNGQIPMRWTFTPDTSGQYSTEVNVSGSYELGKGTTILFSERPMSTSFTVLENTGGPVIVKGPFLLPLQQFKSGIKAEDVKCSDGFTLVIKAEDGSPACVRPDTAHILAERGWTKSAINDAEISAFRTNTSNSNFTINYSITEGNRILDTNITNDTNTISLAISLDAPSNGSMTLVIPHIMDDMIHNKGAQLVVLSDGKEVINYNETEDKIHSITIPIIKGTKQIIVASIVIM
ncbi:MAG: hypothetical protein KGI27_11085 [Thaumarchaeota archaeon]|nr:hypothetical protein [Nitrososphaerota archaeon]